MVDKGQIEVRTFGHVTFAGDAAIPCTRAAAQSTIDAARSLVP